MKKQFLILSLLIMAGMSSVKAQQKQLPAKLKIELTDKQILKIDSAIQTQAQRIDSKQQTIGFINAFADFYKQITEQLVTIPVPETNRVKTDKKQ